MFTIEKSTIRNNSRLGHYVIHRIGSEIAFTINKSFIYCLSQIKNESVTLNLLFMFSAYSDTTSIWKVFSE